MIVVRALFQRASDQFGHTAASLDATSWENPTGCAVSVRELVEHVLAGNAFAVRLLAGARADEARAGIDEIRLEHDCTRQISMSCAAQTDAFARADQTRPLHHPSGDIDYATFVRFRLGELVVHSWDIAVAAGLDTYLDPAIVEQLWRRVEPHRDQMRAMGAYGQGASDLLPPDASLQDRLLDAFGRRPT
jgi:uncharacterized protein (TIGR03086 family)